ncbi:MAG: hypothetical protein EA357_03275 [Micavibrio sp.]|nr:MAG: hypothetical protein EA357_03275 [Micavibrio sp.]
MRPKLQHFFSAPVPKLGRKDFIQTAVPRRIGQRRIHAAAAAQEILRCKTFAAAFENFDDKTEIIPCFFLAKGIFTVFVQQEQIGFAQMVAVHLQF